MPARFVSGPHPAAPGDPALFFRRDFDVREGIRKATLRVTALGVVQAYLTQRGPGG
jgi:alpha-L-rhamnosidase